MRKVIPITTALAAALITVPNAFAQVTSNREPVNNPWPGAGKVTPTSQASDTAFIRQVIHSNYVEVGLGRSAESRTENSAVKDFAERMVEDHNEMNDQWGDLAKKNEMKLGLDDITQAGKEANDRFEDLRGAEFDQAYMSEMIRLHEQALADFQRIGSSSRSSDLRALATSSSSTVRDHLTLARQVGSQVGVSTTAGRVGSDTFRTSPNNDDRRRTTTDRTSGNDRDDRKGDRAALRAEDRAFIQNVLQDHEMHIRLAERAQRQGQSDEIRKFAKEMEEDFEDWSDRWENLAGRYDIKEPSHLGKNHGQKIEKLEKASKRNLDRTYAEIVADHLASVVPYFQKEGERVRPAGARKLAEEELPMIREHLARARRLANRK